jgi:hypothetical protein
MKTDPSTRSQIASRIRGVARVWSVFVFLLAIILVIGTRFTPATSPVNAPFDILIPLSLLISMLGLAVAWRWEGWGSLINFAFYLAIVPIYWLLHKAWLPLSILVALSPVILPGVLFSTAWFLDRKEKNNAHV